MTIAAKVSRRPAAAPVRLKPQPAELRLWIPGPTPTQGDHYPGKRRDGTLYVRSANKDEIDEWRTLVRAAYLKKYGSRFGPMTSPLYAEVIFTFPRSAAAAARGDLFPVTDSKDTDKMQRAAGDALQQCRAIADDKLISEWNARKRYAGIGNGVPGQVGCLLYVRAMLADEV